MRVKVSGKNYVEIRIEIQYNRSRADIKRDIKFHLYFKQLE